MQDGDDLDVQLVRYIQALFDEGDTSAKASDTLHELIFFRSSPRERRTLAWVRRAVAGFSRACPPAVWDPPWEAALVLAHALTLPPRQSRCTMSAAALLLPFDVYRRPFKVLAAQKAGVVRLQERYRHWGWPTTWTT